MPWTICTYARFSKMIDWQCLHFRPLHTLYQAIYSSLNTALSRLCILKYGCARQRAAAIIHIVRTPVFPSGDMNVCRLGVNLNGTGLLASNSPVIHNNTHHTLYVYILTCRFLYVKFEVCLCETPAISGYLKHVWI